MTLAKFRPTRSPLPSSAPLDDPRQVPLPLDDPRQVPPPLVNLQQMVITAQHPLFRRLKNEMKDGASKKEFV